MLQSTLDFLVWCCLKCSVPSFLGIFENTKALTGIIDTSMEFYQIRARSQCSQHGTISPSIYFNVGFACLARAVKAQRGQQYLPPAWSFFVKRGVSRRISASGKHKEYLELNWISKILWFWFTTCSCVPASSISSRELQEDILMYGHVPYLLRSPCFLPHSPRQRPGSG